MTRRSSPSREVLEPAPWDELTRDEQAFYEKVAEDIVRREGPHLTKRYGDNVDGIGHGLCQRGPRKSKDYLVVRFFVRSRRSPDRLARDGQEPIPSFLAKRTRFRGRPVEVRLPTDVEELRYGGPQVKRIQVDRNQRKLLDGSTCCVAAETGTQNRFVMSCYHVYAACGLDPACGCATGLLRYVDDTTDAWLGLSVARTTDLPPLSSGVDAGLAKLPAGASVDTRVCGLRLTGRVVNSRSIPLGAMLRIGTRRGVVDAKFQGVTGPISLPYKCRQGTRTFTFRGLLEYVATPGTRKGDSGSAVVFGSSLAGMHFYLTKKGRSLAIPAASLFAQSTFGRRLRVL